MKKSIYMSLMLLAAVATTGCKNGDQDFDDFEGGTTVYFPYQYPVRTILLGDGVEYSTELDNAHKFKVMGYGAGTYDSYEFTFNVAVEESLAQGVTFKDGREVKILPSSYYQLGSTTSSYVGNRMSGVEVSLTDAFFQDPASISQTYVLPLRMSGVNGANKILEDMDFTLYCVRYVNPWEGYYLVKGTAAELEKCAIVHTATTSLTTCEYTNVDGVSMTLTFGSEKDDNCTISGDGVSGSGNYGHGTEAKAWGNKDRNALYLKYTAGGKSYDETLVLQRRGEFAGTVIEFN
jgi:hypothetical protein